jgi:hypothetical protein
MLIETKVVLTAYNEHVSAKALGKLMRKAFGQPEPPGLFENMKRAPGKTFKTVMGWLRLLESKIRFIKESNQDPLFEDTESGQASPRHLWTHTHSLYATMGGFVVDTRGLSQSYLPDGRQRMTLTLDGLEAIVKLDPDLLPDISQSEIRYKSKADASTTVFDSISPGFFDFPSRDQYRCTCCLRPGFVFLLLVGEVTGC